MAAERSKVLQQAQLLASRGQYDAAIAEWKKLAADAPNDGSIHNSIGDLHLKRNAPAEATASYLQAAAAFRAEGATLKAIAAYKKVLKIDPTRYEVYRHLGDLNAERGLLTSAVQDYLTLGRYYLKEHKGKEALEIYKKIVSQDPSNLDAQQRVAELCVQENLQDEATKVYLQLGRERSAQGRYDEARDAYLAVLRIDPTNSEADQFVSSAQEHGTGTVKQTKSGTSESTQRVSEPLDLLAEAMRRIEGKQYAGAEAILNQLLTREPGNPQVCQLLARVNLQRGDVQVALGEYRFLAGAALRAQDYGLAESLIKEFLSVVPNSVLLLELYGELYEEKGEIAAAVQQYARAVELLLEHPEPGMESLHEELFEKVKSLSTDVVLIDRLAAKMKGEATADVNSRPRPDPAPVPGEDALPVEAVSTAAANGESDAGAKPGEIGVDASANGSADGSGSHAIAADQPAAMHGPIGTAADIREFAEPTVAADRGTETQSAQPHDGAMAGIEPVAVSAESDAAMAVARDHEAHFTLGVAYKNMGLYQEAKEEFEVAKTGDAFYLDSCLMLALCYKEDRQLSQAICVLEGALSDSRCQGAKGQAVHYELGLLYRAEAQWKNSPDSYSLIP